jgi:hypothetical protein
MDTRATHTASIIGAALNYDAARTCSTVFIFSVLRVDVLEPISIRRGFIASGIFRASSI